jgi:hypothetical protein
MPDSGNSDIQNEPNSGSSNLPADGTQLTFSDAWQKIKEVDGISDLYHILLIFLAALGNVLRKFRPLVWVGFLVRRALFYSISYSSPELKLDQTTTAKGQRATFVFLLSLFIGLVVSLGYPMFFSILAGTFQRVNNLSANYVYFRDDTHNLLIYCFLSPLYLACSVTIVLTAFRGWILYPAQPGADRETTASRRHRFVIRFLNISLVVFYLSFMPIFINVAQFNAIMNPTITKNLYWFISENDGTRYVNAAGIAYFILNTLKLVVITAAVLCFLASAIEVLNIGADIRKIRMDSDTTIPQWRDRLRHYALIELFAKSLTLVLAAHLSIFAQQEWSQKTANVTLQALAIVLIGMILIPFPRAYFEFKWMMEERKSEQPIRWPDIRPADLKAFFIIVSWVLYVAAVMLASLFGYQTNIFTILICRLGLRSCT